MSPALAAWPWATFFVNVLGCFLMGLAWVWLTREASHPALKPALMTGVLGAFTTFSAFSLDAYGLADADRGMSATIYVITTVVLCLAATRLGIYVATRLVL
jgi:CrcB protein